VRRRQRHRARAGSAAGRRDRASRGARREGREREGREGRRKGKGRRESWRTGQGRREARRSRAGEGRQVPEMTLLRFAIRHPQAVVFLVVLMVAAGIISGRALPSSIYPPLVFPRAVIIARSGTLPTRTMVPDVTRPLEQAAM